MAAKVHGQSLLGCLCLLADPRRPQGRVYPLVSVLGLLILAAVQGESSLRGMWLWARARWGGLGNALGFDRASHAPALSTLWYILQEIDLEAMTEILAAWTEKSQGAERDDVSIDGKTLRGTKREGKGPLEVITAVGQGLRVVLKEIGYEGGGAIEAAIALLQGMDLRERVVTMDAGLLQRSVIEAILDRGGEYLGPVKENHPEVKEVVEEWIQVERFGVGKNTEPDYVEVDKAHGRVEQREIWVVESRELGDYLETDYGWRGLQLCGYVRRCRKKIGHVGWDSVEQETWVSSLPHMEGIAARIARLLREHWSIENGVYWVRDVTYGEDRSHGRAIGRTLAIFRSVAINLIRGLGYPYIPDGWRQISARADYGLAFLTTKAPQH